MKNYDDFKKRLVSDISNAYGMSFEEAETCIDKIVDATKDEYLNGKPGSDKPKDRVSTWLREKLTGWIDNIGKYRGAPKRKPTKRPGSKHHPKARHGRNSPSIEELNDEMEKQIIQTMNGWEIDIDYVSGRAANFIASDVAKITPNLTPEKYKEEEYRIIVRQILRVVASEKVG